VFRNIFIIDEKKSHSRISQLSITYLLQFDDDSLPLTEAILDSMPLAQYAARHWIDHAKSGRVDPTVLQLILRLFTSEPASLNNWIRMYNIDAKGRQERGDLSMDRSKVCSALYYSSLAGMLEVSDCLLHKGENANAEGGRLGNALQAASFSRDCHGLTNPHGLMSRVVTGAGTGWKFCTRPNPYPCSPGWRVGPYFVQYMLAVVKK